MKKLVVLMLVFISGAAQAALFDRGGGFIYDDVLDVTWTKNPNINSFMNWDESVAWADSLSFYDGVRDVTWDDWRLPSMDVNGDNTIVNCVSATELACRDNELGYMYHQNGVTPSSNVLFSIIPYAYFWSSTEYVPDGDGAWYFGFNNGSQNSGYKTSSLYAWAVRDGDVAAIPVEIDVDPWSSANKVKPHSNDSIVVAVMGGSIATGDATDFDVSQVDPDSLKLGVGEAPNIALNPLYGDYDNDTNTDAVFIFKTQETKISCFDSDVTLAGATFGGVPFAGTDMIAAIDCKAAVLPFDNISPDNVDRFGSSVSISGDRVLVGAYLDDTAAANSGRAYLFDAATGNLTHTFENPGSSPYWDFFGIAVSVSGDRVLVGALYDVNETSFVNSGRAYLFDAVSGNLLHTFDNPSPDPNDYFGNSVSVSGDRVLISAMNDNAYVGRAYLFDAVTGNLVHTFENPSPGPYADRFGNSVSVSGDRVLVGAAQENATGSDSGRAYLFDAVTGNLMHTIENPGQEPAGDSFGSSVSISGDRIAVGAYRDATDGAYSGRAYLFDAASGNLVYTFASPAPETYDDFGGAVSVAGDRVLVGAPRAANGNTGRAFLFDAVTGNLTQILENPSPGSADLFGSAVSVSGDGAAVGAHRDATTGNQSGRAYLFFDGLSAEVEVTPLTAAPDNGTVHVNHQGQGVPDDAVPLVVLGSDTLDVTLIDPASVRLGPGRAPIDPASTSDLNYNHNDDGFTDARFEFKMSDTGFFYNGVGKPCYAPAVLSGELSTGEMFAGEDLSVPTDCDAQCHN